MYQGKLYPEASSRVYCAVKFRGAKLHGDGEAGSNNMEKWQDGRLLRHLGGSCGDHLKHNRMQQHKQNQTKTYKTK